MSDQTSGKQSKASDLLVSVAESIGSTLGSIAAKVSKAKKAVVQGTLTRKATPSRKKRTATRAAKKVVKIPKVARKTAGKLRAKSRRSAGPPTRTVGVPSKSK